VIDDKDMDVAEAHPELHHYTTWAGLSGIIKSKSLWSVQYDHMNDPTEFFYSKVFLASELTPILKRDLIVRMRQSAKLARKFREAGGLQRVVDHEVKNWIDAHFNALLYVGIQKKMKIPFCIPHITSFCSHKDDMDYERDNGLLSQWRGYGTKGAYALVFDTAKLSDLIRKEYRQYTYHQGSMFDIRYDRQPTEISDDYSHLVESVATSYTNHVFGEGDVNVDADTLLKLATRLKHRGFFEEREVRLVMCPMYQDYADAYGDNPDLVKDPKIKKRHDRPKPHIALFEDLGEELPINRIIVGPSATQRDDVERTRALVGSKIKIIPSETPYRLI
jgi:hypothetical protein